MTIAEVTAIAEEAGRQGKVVGLRLPLDEEDEEPWAAPPSGRNYQLPDPYRRASTPCWRTRSISRAQDFPPRSTID
jgi:hypothetical protein